MENKMFLTVLGLQAALSILTILALLTQPAHAESAHNPLHDITWVWSSTSAEVNNATSALASGHPARAVRFASAVTAENPTDRLLASQNLCLAHLARRDVTTAETHCRAALLMPSTALVIHRRGALVTTDGLPRSKDRALDLADIVRANISAAYGVTLVENFADPELRADLW
ncbi:MAG: hypothetical protein K2P94_05365 [Rhodospirillaceae bacterium]|nr:hypothetical protein [Rhodospirillaceae bacterium]